MIMSFIYMLLSQTGPGKDPLLPLKNFFWINFLCSQQELSLLFWQTMFSLVRVVTRYLATFGWIWCRILKECRSGYSICSIYDNKPRFFKYNWIESEGGLMLREGVVILRNPRNAVDVCFSYDLKFIICCTGRYSWGTKMWKIETMKGN